MIGTRGPAATVSSDGFVEGLGQGDMLFPESLFEDQRRRRLDPFGHWAAAAGLPLGQSAEDDDADGDGLSNFLEYAIGSSPTIATSGQDQLPVVATDKATGALTLTFHRHLSHLTYIVWGSNDLQTWTIVARNPGEPGQVVTVVDTMPSAPRRFLRLGITSDLPD